MSDSKSSILKKNIAELLREKPHLRDDMHRTLAVVWKFDLSNMRNADGSKVDWDKMTAHEFIKEIAMGYDSQLSNPESVRRLWQKVQQDNKELRGEKWRERHGLSEVKKREEFRSDIFTHPQNIHVSPSQSPANNPIQE